MRISDWSSDVCSSDLLLFATCLPERARKAKLTNSVTSPHRARSPVPPDRRGLRDRRAGRRAGRSRCAGTGGTKCRSGYGAPRDRSRRHIRNRARFRPRSPKIGIAHVLSPVTNSPLVFLLLLLNIFFFFFFFFFFFLF